MGYKDLQTWTVIATVPGSGSLASYTSGSGLRTATEGLEPIVSRSQVAIFPNPTVVDVLQISNAYSEGFTRLMLYGTSGRTLVQQVIDSDQMKVDMESLGKGIYMLKLWKADGQSRQFKILK